MIENKYKILDCTLRDGGYYTDWDFNSQLVKDYLESMNKLPLDYLEIGYRSKPMKDYLGEYFYLPKYKMEFIRSISSKKLAIILNEKDVKEEDLTFLLNDCIGLIDMVRIAVDPKNILRAISLAKSIKSFGFEVGLNVMYMSTWKDNPQFFEDLKGVNRVADYFYMVDSFGGLYPEDLEDIYELVTQKVKIPIGFHGHNNLELALINTLTAIKCGVQIIDATITGMGRGAGNLKTELLLTSLSKRENLDFDFNALSKVVDGFTKLQESYNWGTNLPYMFSGANSLPQKNVMDWIGKRFYSFNSILRALKNQKEGLRDNIKLPVFTNLKKYSSVLIVGGGETVTNNIEAILHYLKNNKDTLVIHASSKNSLKFMSIENNQIFCLVGNEGYRMENVFKNNLPEEIMCILPSYPRKMGTYIPDKLKDFSFELPKSSLYTKYSDSHTALAIETALQLGLSEVKVVGYDGYNTFDVSSREVELFQENEYIFKKAADNGLNCFSLTSTSYNNLPSLSIHSLL